MIPDDEIIIEDEFLTLETESLMRRILLVKKAALGDAAELSTRIIKKLSKRAQSKTRIGTLDFAASHDYPAFLPMF